MDTTMTRILVSSSQLREMLDRQPEVELQLIRNAVPQIAEVLRRKAQYTKHQIEERVRKAWDEIVARKDDRFGLPDKVKEVVRVYLAQECRDEARALLTKEAQRLAAEEAGKAVSAVMLKLGQDLEKAVARSKAEVDEYIKASAEREVLALLRAGGPADRRFLTHQARASARAFPFQHRRFRCRPSTS